ncbi:MAG: hypothetical protein WC852_02245 [Candidatus Nanoarchaeia archaeon]|jgi:hypothetical protein
MKDLNKIAAKASHKLTTLGVAVYFVTGFGIVYPAMEKITFGLLTRSLCLTLHKVLAVPFLVVTAAHVYFALKSKLAREKAEKLKNKK